MESTNLAISIHLGGKAPLIACVTNPDQPVIKNVDQGKSVDTTLDNRVSDIHNAELSARSIKHEDASSHEASRLDPSLTHHHPTQSAKHLEDKHNTHNKMYH